MEDYRLQQSGQEVQDILNGAAMQVDLTAETERAELAEQTLQGNIDIEERDRKAADLTLQGNIDAEETRAKAAEKQNADDIDAIEEKIPSGASSSNKLATEDYVNDKVATDSATFRGTYNLVSDIGLLPTATHDQIAYALSGKIATADNNDYAFVQIPTSVETPTEIEKIERYKFNGEAWAFEYDLNNSGFTAAQWAAINSGITSGDVTKLAALPTNSELNTLLNGKQDTLTFDNTPTENSNNPVKSGGVYSGIKAEEERAKAAEKVNADDIDAIEEKIPSGASSSNKLATEEYVNDSVATATATFRGTYNVVTDLSLLPSATHSQISASLKTEIASADSNDYAFVLIPTSVETPEEIEKIERYKYNGSVWGFEYVLNNSGFTAVQWAAINSGITSGDVAKLAALPTSSELTTLLNGKQDTLTFDNTPTENSNNPVKSGGVYSGIKTEEERAKAAEKVNADDIDAIEEKIPSGATSSNKLATASDVTGEATARENADAALQQAIEAILLLIPSAATSVNKLADKAFVNSSIATATATFRGTYNLVNDLGLMVSATHAQIATALAGAVVDEDNNDYAFVQIPTSDATPTQIAKTERYKFNGTAWEYEYDLNNSGYTADQWAAINSGITAALVSKLSELPINAELTTALGLLSDGIAAINGKIPSEATTSNKLVDTAAMQSYVTQIINAIDATFNVGSADGHVAVQITQVNGVITNVAVTTSDIASASALTLVTGRVTDAEANIVSLSGRMTTAEDDIDDLQQLYNNLQQSAPVVIEPTDTWPVAVADRSATVIYRVVDRVNTPPQYYSDYMFRASDLSGQPVLMAQYDNAIDPRPKKGSANLVTSGGVFDNMGALDVSELNATENPHTLATYADLSAAIAAIPSDYQKGGMIIKFVQSSDNKYVQARLMAQNFTTDVTQWQGVDSEPVTGSSNLVESGGVDSFAKSQSAQFAKTAPCITELYFTVSPTDVELNLHSIQRNYNGKWYVSFCNNAGNAFTAETRDYTNEESATGVLPIYQRSSRTVIYGYIIINWDKIAEGSNNVRSTLNNSAFKLTYSPTISLFLSDYDTEINNVNTKINTTKDTLANLCNYTFSDEKDLKILPSSISNSSLIFFQIPKLRTNFVNKVFFKAKTGTINFYKITIIENEASYELLTSVTNSSAENGRIKTITVSWELENNQYIGINGDIYFGIDEYAQGYKGGNINMSTGAITIGSTIALGFLPVDTNAIGYKVSELEKVLNINTLPLGNAVGRTIENRNTIITLASDGTGDYSTFAEAHASCNSANNAIMLIKPGIYTIPVSNSNGFTIGYDIIGQEGAILKCSNTESGDTFVAIKQRFAPFMIYSGHTNHKTIRIEGVTLIVQDVRYCVHDEMGGLASPSYTHVYKNCKFIHLTQPDSQWDSPRCIGGGLGNHGLVIIENCEFKSEIETSVDYHTGFNGGQQSSKVIIKDCVLANNTVSCTTANSVSQGQSEYSIMVVQGNVLHSTPICNVSETAGKKIDLIEKDNILV